MVVLGMRLYTRGCEKGLVAKIMLGFVKVVWREV